MGEVLGEGAYGRVKRLRVGARDLAVKTMNDHHWASGISAEALREVCLLHHLRHRNVVEFMYADYVVGSHLKLFFACAPATLSDVLAEEGPLPPARARKFAADLFRGLAYVHGQRVMHRDIKPPNLLITGEGDLVIADFGLARKKSQYERSYTVDVVTLWYRPPELLLRESRYGYEIDVWSAGAVVLEMALDRAPFAGYNEVDELFRICRVLGTVPDVAELPQWPLCRDGAALRRRVGAVPCDLGDAAFDVLARALTVVPSERCCAAAALKVFES